MRGVGEIDDGSLVAKGPQDHVDAYYQSVSRLEKRVCNHLIRLVANREDPLDLTREVGSSPSFPPFRESLWVGTERNRTESCLAPTDTLEAVATSPVATALERNVTKEGEASPCRD